MGKLEIRELEDGKIAIIAPYSPRFVKLLKNSGAKWNGSVWTATSKITDVVRTHMVDVYGYDDTMEDVDLVSIHIVFNENVCELCGAITLFDKPICRAFGRDSGAKISDDACFVKGSPDSGGSARNWKTCISKGCEVRLLDVCREKYLKEKEDEEERWYCQTWIEGEENNPSEALGGKMQVLYELLLEISDQKPSCGLTPEWEDVFEKVENLKKSMHDADAEDSCIPGLR